MAFLPRRKKSRSTADSDEGTTAVTVAIGKPRLDELINFAKTGKLLGPKIEIMTYGSEKIVTEDTIVKMSSLTLINNSDHVVVADDFSLDEADKPIDTSTKRNRKTQRDSISITVLMESYLKEQNKTVIYARLNVDGLYSLGKPYDLVDKGDYKGWTSHRIITESIQDDIYKELMDDGQQLRYKIADQTVKIGYYDKKSKYFSTDRNKSYVSLFNEKVAQAIAVDNNTTTVNQVAQKPMLEDTFWNSWEQQQNTNSVFDYEVDEEGAVNEVTNTTKVARKSQVAKQAEALAKVGKETGTTVRQVPKRPGIVEKVKQIMKGSGE